MKDDRLNIVGENIMRVRKLHNLTQAQFADLIGKSQSTVNAYEKGDIVPPFDVLLVIASIFDTQVGKLMGLKNPMQSIMALRKAYEIAMGGIGDDDE